MNGTQCIHLPSSNDERTKKSKNNGCQELTKVHMLF